MLRRTVINLLAAVGVALVAATPATAEKYGLDDISDEDRQQLVTLIDALAKVEVLLTVCDAPPRYDVRLQDEVRLCIKAESIDRIQNFFETRAQLHRQSIGPDLCTREDIGPKIPEFKSAMDSALWQIGLMCTLCLFC